MLAVALVMQLDTPSQTMPLVIALPNASGPQDTSGYSVCPPASALAPADWSHVGGHAAENVVVHDTHRVPVGAGKLQLECVDANHCQGVTSVS